MTIHIACTNFWPTFSLENGLIKHLLDLAFDYDWEATTDQKDADLILKSVFPHQASRYPEKSICLIWENIRPDYRGYRFSISHDFDDYGGRNVRCPVWYSQIKWSEDMVIPSPSGGGAHNHEPLVPLSTLLAPRTVPYKKRSKFCAIVASNPENFRIRAAEALSEIEPVNAYGPIAGAPDPRSKFEILDDYVFSLCFENSIFPGYYTEKALHAWVAGTIPLYFSDDKFVEDFNGDAIINRSDFLTMRSFVNEVRRLREEPEALEWVWRQPLLLREPSLDPIVEFLREAFRQIQRS